MDNEKKVWNTPKVEQLVFKNTESGPFPGHAETFPTSSGPYSHFQTSS